MRKPRQPESTDQRKERLREGATRQIADDQTREAAVEEMIRQNLEQHGP